jgi:hypothetical protein
MRRRRFRAALRPTRWTVSVALSIGDAAVWHLRYSQPTLQACTYTHNPFQSVDVEKLIASNQKNMGRQ